MNILTQEECNEALKKIDIGIFQIKLQIKIRELGKIIKYYENNVYPFACYDSKYVSYENRETGIQRLNILITYDEARKEFNKLNAFFQLIFKDDYYSGKLRELITEEFQS